MGKDTSLYIEESARHELTMAIKTKIDREKLAAAISAKKSQRSDALERVIINAVKNSSVVSFSGIPHVYSPKHGKYVSFDYYEFKMAIYDAMRKLEVPDGLYGYVDKMTKLCWADVQSRRCGVDNSVVVMKNGVFDTMDMTVKEFGDRFMTNMSVPYEYNPNEVAVGWKRFLNEVLPDIDMQMLLQEFIAAAYVDRRMAKIEYALILLGKGSNGKSVVFEVLSELIGSDSMSNFSIADLIGQKREQNVAAANGKRINYCSEIHTTEIDEHNADAFKSLVSGEDQMARNLYREPFKATNIPLIMANANKMPRLKDTSTALQRRLLIIPFETYIPEEKQNIELATELKKELSGIFNWVMEGLGRLKTNKYKITVPFKVKKIVQEYIIDNDTVSRWLMERNTLPRRDAQGIAELKYINTSELFSEFNEWCKKSNELLKTRREFSYEMEVRGFQKVRKSDAMYLICFVVPSQEEIAEANMDLAIAMQSQEYLAAIRKATEEKSTVQVVGIEDLERYLGLPKDCIWPYMRSGHLNGAYSTKGKGQPVFDVQKVQAALAAAGFYTELQSDTNSCKRRATNVLKGMRQTFNERMRAMNVPIRKFGNTYSYIPAKDKDCWIVSDDWEYSKLAAEKVMAQPKQIY